MSGRARAVRDEHTLVIELGGFTLPVEVVAPSTHVFNINKVPPRYGCTYRIGTCDVCGGMSRIVLEPYSEVECLGTCKTAEDEHA